jgi:excisionase family DNA binding protein
MGLDLEVIIEAAVERGIKRAMEQLRRPEAVQAELLTVKQAAARANVGADTIRRWIKEGMLTPRGSRGKLLVRSDELLNVQPKRTEERTADDVVADILKRMK